MSTVLNSEVIAKLTDSCGDTFLLDSWTLSDGETKYVASTWTKDFSEHSTVAITREQLIAIAHRITEVLA